MSQTIGKYLISISASAMLLSVSQTLLPKGAVRQIAGFVGGLLVILSVLSPVVALDVDDISQYIPVFSFQPKTEAITGGEEILSDIIKQRCQSYILDKANGLGAELKVAVALSEDAPYPYPVSVVLTGCVTPEQQKELTEEISLEMGISPQQQEWNVR